MLKKLRLKFVLITMGIVTAMLVVIFVTVYHFTRLNLETSSISMMQAIASDPFRENPPGGGGENSPMQNLPYIALRISPDGAISASGGSFYDLTDEAFLRKLVEEADRTTSRTGVLPELKLRFLKHNAQAFRIYVYADTSSEEETLRNLRVTFLVIGTLGLLVFFGLSILLARWAVKPVEQAFAREKQFVADASHELRTPLTVITTNAELLRDDVADRPEDTKYADNVLRSANRMRTLTEELLTLARSDMGVSAGRKENVDLSDLVEEAVLNYEPVFFEKGLQLAQEIEEKILITGNSEELRRLTAILLDNAQKYGRSGGTTTVTLKRTSRFRCMLSVADEGEEIPEEILSQLFTRFFRADEARSGEEGFGLGLSIAEEIVSHHNGRIRAESADGLNIFTVEFPLS
ncbi:MAG: HAMP domain-containing histidine kinase [Lachnospiraceae bacterium]|nr:HAMP domain-containing histidine kinase [Lachnospiraceae bacterium]